MDEMSREHMQLFMNNSIRNREAEASYKETQFPVDANGNMVFDEDGWVTRSKKASKLSAKYYKAVEEFPGPDEEPTLLPATYIEESNPERDNRIILYVKVDILKPLDEICQFFAQAGKIKSVLVSCDEILRKRSFEIEFYSIKSVAVAVALAVKNRLPNVCTKTENIRVDDCNFPVEEAKCDRVFNSPTTKHILNQKIHLGFSHIPVTVDWLEKVFRVFDVVDHISLPRPINHTHLGRAILQLGSINGVHEAIRLNKKLKFSYKNVEVKLEVTAVDGTTWQHDGTLKIVCVPPKEDDGLL